MNRPWRRGRVALRNRRDRDGHWSPSGVYPESGKFAVVSRLVQWINSPARRKRPPRSLSNGTASALLFPHLLEC